MHALRQAQCVVAWAQVVEEATEATRARREDHFAASREWEERAFRKHVTDWELGRYFEII